MNPNEMPPQVAILSMATSYWVSKLVYVAAKLGIADHLKDGPRSSGDLAKSVDVDPGALYRVLRALSMVGVFTEVEQDSFALTPLGEVLRSDVPGSMRYMAMMPCEENYIYRTWDNIMESVKTGKPIFEKVHGVPLFDHFDRNPELSDVFDKAMLGFSTMNRDAMLHAYDFSRFKKLVDVGGGHGTFLAGLLKAYPELHAVLLDRAAVLDGARANLTTAGVVDRCELVAGNFFESVPSGGDAYFMSAILLDWDDEKSSQILKNCRNAMDSNGTLLLGEMVMPPGNGPFWGKLFDINVLINTGSHVRTEGQFRELLSSCGFKVNKVNPTMALVSIIEAVPA
jgi:hypothetical protein